LADFLFFKKYEKYNERIKFCLRSRLRFYLNVLENLDKTILWWYNGKQFKMAFWWKQ
jgi:hypothetical protein